MKNTFSRTGHPSRARGIAIAVVMAAALASRLQANAASPSELLEKAVYAEETKGDLDSAIAIYQQLVTESKATHTFAAEAQYRLGLCYHKKKNYAAATIAFERLIKDFPDEKELVAKAKQYLPGNVTLNPVPWTSGEVLQLAFKFQSGFKLGTVAYSATEVQSAGQKSWRVDTRTLAGTHGMSTVLTDGDAFRPVRSRWKHGLIGDVEAVYKPGKVELRTKGKPDQKVIDLDGPVFDNEQWIQLVRRLPLEVGYKVTLPTVSSLGGGITIPVALEVTSKETLQVEAGTFECFKVETNIKQTFWYSTDHHRYVVKLEAGGASAELAAVWQRAPGQNMRFRDTATKVSMQAPWDWLFFKFDRDKSLSDIAIAILEPDAIADCGLRIEDSDDLKPQERSSVRAWAEANLDRTGKQYKQFKIRPESWSERFIAGHPAVSAIADGVTAEKTEIVYGVFAFVGNRAVRFFSEVETDAFEAFQKAFDEIVASCQMP
jgi:hypothetical protein